VRMGMEVGVSPRERESCWAMFGLLGMNERY
jgi:hypothetical protein